MREKACRGLVRPYICNERNWYLRPASGGPLTDPWTRGFSLPPAQWGIFSSLFSFHSRPDTPAITRSAINRGGVGAYIEPFFAIPGDACPGMMQKDYGAIGEYPDKRRETTACHSARTAGPGSRRDRSTAPIAGRGYRWIWIADQYLTQP